MTKGNLWNEYEFRGFTDERDGGSRAMADAGQRSFNTLVWMPQFQRVAVNIVAIKKDQLYSRFIALIKRLAVNIIFK